LQQEPYSPGRLSHNPTVQAILASDLLLAVDQIPVVDLLLAVGLILVADLLLAVGLILVADLLLAVGLILVADLLLAVLPGQLAVEEPTIPPVRVLGPVVLTIQQPTIPGRTEPKSVDRSLKQLPMRGLLSKSETRSPTHRDSLSPPAGRPSPSHRLRSQMRGFAARSTSKSTGIRRNR